MSLQQNARKSTKKLLLTDNQVRILEQAMKKYPYFAIMDLKTMATKFVHLRTAGENNTNEFPELTDLNSRINQKALQKTVTSISNLMYSDCGMISSQFKQEVNRMEANNVPQSQMYSKLVKKQCQQPGPSSSSMPTISSYQESDVEMTEIVDNSSKQFFWDDHPQPKYLFERTKGGKKYIQVLILKQWSIVFMAGTISTDGMTLTVEYRMGASCSEDMAKMVNAWTDADLIKNQAELNGTQNVYIDETTEDVDALVNIREVMDIGTDVVTQSQFFEIRLPFQVIVNNKLDETHHIPNVIAVKEKKKRHGAATFKTAEWFIFEFQEKKSKRKKEHNMDEICSKWS